jgi:hypothetical protein
MVVGSAGKRWHTQTLPTFRPPGVLKTAHHGHGKRNLKLDFGMDICGEVRFQGLRCPLLAGSLSPARTKGK